MTARNRLKLYKRRKNDTPALGSAGGFEQESPEVQMTRQKMVAFYSANYTGFLDISKVRDTTLIGISTLFIGGLTGRFFTLADRNESQVASLIYLIAATFFVVAVKIILHIFAKNRDFLQLLSNPSDPDQIDSLSSNIDSLDAEAKSAVEVGLSLSVVGLFFELIRHFGLSLG